MELEGVGDVDGAGFVGFTTPEGGRLPGRPWCLPAGAVAHVERGMQGLDEEDRHEQVKARWGGKPP